MNNPRIYYHDFVTGQMRYTQNKFVGWQEGSLINAYEAVFVGNYNMIFIPHYLLVKESLAIIPVMPKINIRKHIAT